MNHLEITEDLVKYIRMRMGVDRVDISREPGMVDTIRVHARRGDYHVAQVYLVEDFKEEVNLDSFYDTFRRAFDRGPKKKQEIEMIIIDDPMAKKEKTFDEKMAEWERAYELDDK